MSLRDYIDPALILTDVVCDDNYDALRKIAGVMCEKGFVKESFADAVIERERIYPTGLVCEALNVAIPHADAEHVLRPGLAVAMLRKCTDFMRMDDETVTVPVRMVLMMGIVDPKAQLSALRELMQLLQDHVYISRLTDCCTSAEIYQTMMDALK